MWCLAGRCGRTQVASRSTVVVPTTTSSFYGLPSLSSRSYRSSAVVEKYFDKILVANRGEIACRIMSTAKKLGIKTVAVFSDADMHSKHVLMADEAVNIGPAPSSQSYLLIDKILEACKKTGAQAVHPGYGFLSENMRFVAELEKAGITFIGPNSSAMDALGDKIHSKKIAKNAGVSVVPGFVGEVTSPQHGLEISREIGYPIIIKPSAGGGGKGMRIANNDEEALEGIRFAKAEAASSFGDDRLLIERYIESPRHIELQVLGDSHGNVVYLNERECSIQRRNQKVIEEAPSTFITPQVRKAMGEEAVNLCKAVNYKSAGTCEFLVDKDSNFYFLEMNTRLQVEHPVTEYITGVDIVEQMIKVAAGEKLDITQSDIKINGWSFESRVYAEDPLNKFFPQIGKLSRYSEPVPDKDLRVDSGVSEGSEISVYYDPLIAKVISHGKTRQAAIDTMKDALDCYVIRGVTHNVCLLRDILDNKEFVKGDINTGFIPKHYPDGFHGHKLTAHEQTQLLSVGVGLHHLRKLRDETAGQGIQVPNGEFTVPSQISIAEYVIALQGEKHLARLETVDFKAYRIFFNNSAKPTHVDLSEYPIDQPIVVSYHDDEEQVISQLISVTPLGFKIQFSGTIYNIDIYSPKEAAVVGFMKEPVGLALNDVLLSPMAGTVVSIAVEEGQVVKQGQELAVVEAMKMQNQLRAHRQGKVKKILAAKGDSILADSVILELYPEEEEKAATA